LKEEIIINIDPIEIMIEVQEGKKEDIIDQILVKDVIEDLDTPEVDHKIKRNIIKKKNIITDQNLETKKRKSIKTQKKNIKNIIVPLDIPVKKNKNLKKDSNKNYYNENKNNNHYPQNGNNHNNNNNNKHSDSKDRSKDAGHYEFKLNEVIGNYELVKHVSDGTFGRVFEVK
jgi:E3 ubiquitin-protein ligase DOA10